MPFSVLSECKSNAILLLLFYLFRKIDDVVIAKIQNSKQIVIVYVFLLMLLLLLLFLSR